MGQEPGADRQERPQGRREPRPRYSRGDSPPLPSPVSETVRAPLSASGTPSPAGWSFELFPGLSFAAVAAAAAQTGARPGAGGGHWSLPSISGGAPGVFSDFADAFSWAKGAVFDPIGSAVTGFPANVVRDATQAVAGFFAIAGWWIYKFIGSYVGPGWPRPGRTATPEQARFISAGFPPPSLVTGLSPWYYLHLIGSVLWYGISTKVSAAADWLRARVGEEIQWVWRQISGAFTTVYSWVGDAARWLRTRVGENIQWVWGQISGGFTTVTSWVDNAARWLRARVGDEVQWVWRQISGGFTTVSTWVSEAADWLRARVGEEIQWVWGQVSGGFTTAADLLGDAADWLWAQTSAGFDATIAEIPRAVIAGGQAIGDVVFDAVKWLGNSVFEPFADVVEAKLAIPGKLFRAEYASLGELIDDVMDPPRALMEGLGGLLMLPAMFGALVSIIFGGISGPLMEPIQQQYQRMVGVRIPSYQALRDGFRRGFLTGPQVADALGRSGFDLTNTMAQMKQFEELPGPSDLVRMGVREVFTPAVAERFGQFQEFPDAFAFWMGKLGFGGATQELGGLGDPMPGHSWAEAFWAAHWDLPSIQQGMEMFHRGATGPDGEPVTLDTLNLLLRALDVMPAWRQGLIDIAYNPFTRVDVRRMYSAGVIERAEVERTYRALGYAPADAVTLTEWVIKQFPRKTDDPNAGLRGLSLGTIKQAYARRLIDRETALEDVIALDYAPDDAELIIDNWEFEWTVDPGARSDLPLKDVGVSVIERAYERRLIGFNAGVTELTEMGFTPEDARLRLQLVDLGLEEQLANLQIDAALNDFENGLISDAQFAARLADINVPQGRIDFLLQREILSREVKNQRLTLSQMKRAVAAGFISEDEYRARLDARGYNTRDVEILVALEVEAV